MTFWPQHVEQKGPWQRLADLSVNKPKAKQPLHAVKVSTSTCTSSSLSACSQDVNFHLHFCFTVCTACSQNVNLHLQTLTVRPPCTTNLCIRLRCQLSPACGSNLICMHKQPLHPLEVSTATGRVSWSLLHAPVIFAP